MVPFKLGINLKGIRVENTLERTIIKLRKWQDREKFENNSSFKKLLESCEGAKLSNDNAVFLAELYDKVKDLRHRNTILKALIWCEDYDLKEFFLRAFARERYLDIRLTAIRGYANYASEQEVDKLMGEFTEILIKRPEVNPYNYHEYEMLRSAFGLPYLVKRFGYQSFITAQSQLDKQYNDMPDVFKGSFTLDDKGKYIELISSEVWFERINDFWKEIIHK
jgi:hypothetical protein